MEISVFLKEPLLEIGLILITGFIFGNVADFFKLPRVSGYIVAGILMSPHLFGLIDRDFLERSTVLIHGSLSAITFLIGGNLKWDKVKALGKTIAVITLGEAETAFLAVTIGMFILLRFLGQEGISVLAAALLFGALASPTDPAATLAVIHEYRAKGVLTTSVLGVAALDDATGIVNFVVGNALALALLGCSVTGLEILEKICLKIFGAILLGFLSGYMLHILGWFAKERKEVVTVTFSILFIAFSVAHILGFDELLTTMTIGICLVNVDIDNSRYFLPLENYIEDFIFTAFFVIGSAFLNLNVLFKFYLIVLFYIAIRFAGKFLGVFVGGHLSHAPSEVKKYLVFALFPQGGIVIGLALLAYQAPQFKDIGLLLVNVVIGATAIHEFMGPIFSKLALKRAGEISPTD